MPLQIDPELHETNALRRLVSSFAGLHVLEIGAGDGRVTRLYAEEAASVIAIDPHDDDIAALRAELPQVDARAIGFEELELPPASVDAVLFTWSL